MLRYSGGDARKLLNILELVVEADGTDQVVITDAVVAERLQQNPLAYDKVENCTMTSYRLSSKVFGGAIRTPLCIGWHE